MNAWVPILALTLTALGCGATVDSEPSLPELPDVPATELEPVTVPGPRVDCRADAGALDCSLAVEDGFRVQMLSVLVQTDDRFEEHTFAGDFEISTLREGLVNVAVFDRYPVTLDVQMHFEHEAIEAPTSLKVTEASVRCQVTLNGAQSAPVVCEAGAFERWNAFLVPEAALVDAWEAGELGDASVRATLEYEADGERMCFREYPSCDTTGLTEKWFDVIDDSGEIPEALQYIFTVPAEAATSVVSVTTNVMYSPATLDGPGIYVVGADGQLTKP